MHTLSNSDRDIPVKRLQLNVVTCNLVATPKKELFILGPIPLEWLAEAAALPGKTLNVAMALYWHHGMTRGKPFKLTRRALEHLNVKRDAAGLGLDRLEEAGLIQVERKPGRRPTVTIRPHTAVAL
jgi:DNA-binding MarR family transcriptional regulator